MRATELRQIKVDRRRIRADVLRPGVHEHGVVPQLDHLHRRRRGDPAAPRLPDRAAVRALDLPRGRLPADQRPPAERRPSSQDWVDEITIHTFVHENIKDFMQGFRYDANPMGMLVASVGALSTFYPDANKIHDERVRAIQIIRLLAKMPTLAAFAFRHNMGQPYVYPDNDLDYAGNFLGMMYKMTELKYEPDPRLERALDVLFILHADHEQNASTSAVRSVGSTQVDPYTAVAAGVAALYGPLHGGANEAALRMLERIEQRREHPRLPRGRQGGQRAPDGLRPPRLQELRPARADHPQIPRRRLRGARQEPAAGRRDRAREARARRRLLHLAQALPERRLLLRPDLRGARPARSRCSR